MKPKVPKMALIAIVVLIFTFPIFRVVYAQGTGIDIIALAQGKVNSLVATSTTGAATDIQNERVKTENNILNYIDSYIKGLTTDINNYTNTQKASAISKIDQNYTDIKQQLDSNRQTLMDNAKSQIDQTINQAYQDQQNILNNDLQQKIADKFK